MAATSPARIDIAELCTLVERHHDLCEQRHWKFTFRDCKIILRNTAAKVLAWLDEFKQVGDIVVNHDLQHFALPWAGVRFLLVVSFLPSLFFNFSHQQGAY